MSTYIKHNEDKAFYHKQKLALYENAPLNFKVKYHISHVKSTFEHLSETHDAIKSYQIPLEYIFYLCDTLEIIEKEGLKEFCEKNKSYKHIKFIGDFNNSNLFKRRDLINACSRLKRSLKVISILDVLPPLIVTDIYLYLLNASLCNISPKNNLF